LAKERFLPAIGEVDLLAHNNVDFLVTFSSAEFVGVNYYDGRVSWFADLGVTSALELDGASVCVQTGTTTELNGGLFPCDGLS
jgi:general L-amino acid transport system substrate-binding protein